MEANQQNRLHIFLPYIIGGLGAVLSFFGGNYLNYLSYTNKVDVLTKAVTNLTEIVNKQSDKIDASNERYNSLDKRTSKIEFYLFEYKKPESEHQQQ